MTEKLRSTKEVLAELGISYSTLYRLRKTLSMFTTERKLKRYYSEKDIEEINNQLRKENGCIS